MAGRLDLGFRDELIEQYFKLGYNHAEILLCLLLLHDRELSLRQLKRILDRRGLKRRHNSSDVRTVLTAVEQELRGSGSDVGYRPGEVLLGILGRGVPPGSLNPDPISDQNMPFGPRSGDSRRDAPITSTFRLQNFGTYKFVC